MNCRKEHICIMHIMACKEKLVYTVRLGFCFPKENQSHSLMITIGALSLMIGITNLLMNKLLASPLTLLFGLMSLR